MPPGTNIITYIVMYTLVKLTTHGLCVCLFNHGKHTHTQAKIGSERRRNGEEIDGVLIKRISENQSMIKLRLDTDSSDTESLKNSNANKQNPAKVKQTRDRCLNKVNCSSI